MYNQQVLKAFHNVKNYGRIKNADGVGKVGNIVCGDVMQLYLKVGKNAKGKEIVKDIKFETFGCLPLEEEILANEGDWEKIGNFKNFDFVLDGRGIKTKVKRKSIRKYDGQILEIIPFVSHLNKFSITPDHPILAVKRDKIPLSRKSGGAWLRIDHEKLKQQSPEFIPAFKLKPGDYIIYQPNTTIKDSKFYSKELLLLLGYYLAEGYPIANDGAVAFAFNKKEKKIIGEVKQLIKAVTCKNASFRIRKNVCEIYFCSRKWAKFFKSTAGKYAYKKKLSEEILLLPFPKQWQMIMAYLNGDGNKYYRRPQDFKTYRMATASRKLAIQLQEILARGGILSSIKKSNHPNRSHIEGRKVNAKPVYEISFRLKRKKHFFHHVNNHFLVPIKEIKSKKYQGLVANLEMSNNSESYLVRGYVVHNCVAAIATSVKITEMAKGKTLDEALKISQKEIVDSLGGLPPVKIHCSVLAADALSEAIYDYLKKNKKVIPAELEKRHRRVEKERQMVEEKYHDWTGKQFPS